MNQKLQYHLKKLEECMESKLNPLNTQTHLNLSALDEVLSNIQAEQFLIKRLISKEVNRLFETRLVKQFIQTFQISLINVLDNLMTIIDLTINAINTNQLHIYKILLGVQKAVYIIIENLLSYIGYRYYNFCNPDIRVSEKYKCLFLREIKKEIREIEGGDYKINKQLFELAFSPVKKRLDTKIGLTYSMVLFYRELIRVTHDIKKIENKEEHEDELIRALIFINFNSVYFVKYCVTKMKLGMEKQFQIIDKIEFLALCIKRINQSPIRRGMALFRNYPHVKELLSQWVLAEICYWERKLQLQTPFQKDANFLIDTTIKIATDLSVPQLACFVRLLVDTGTITNVRKEDILEFFPAYYKSKKCESFEYGSFRSKYYAISESTKQHIKDRLIKMLNELRKL